MTPLRRTKSGGVSVLTGLEGKLGERRRRYCGKRQQLAEEGIAAPDTIALQSDRAAKPLPDIAGLVQDGKEDGEVNHLPDAYIEKCPETTGRQRHSPRNMGPSGAGMSKMRLPAEAPVDHYSRNLDAVDQSNQRPGECEGVSSKGWISGKGKDDNLLRGEFEFVGQSPSGRDGQDVPGTLDKRVQRLGLEDDVVGIRLGVDAQMKIDRRERRKASDRTPKQEVAV